MVLFWLAGAGVSSRPVPLVWLLAMRAFEATGPCSGRLLLLAAAALLLLPAAAWCLLPSAPLGAAWCCLLLLPAGCLGLPPAVACAPSLSPRAILELSPIHVPLMSYI